MLKERYVDKEVRVKASIDAVWQAWTTTDGIKRFFAPDANVEARVDGPFEIYISPLAAPGLKGADGMRFLAIQDGKMRARPGRSPIRSRSNGACGSRARCSCASTNKEGR